LIPFRSEPCSYNQIFSFWSCHDCTKSSNTQYVTSRKHEKNSFGVQLPPILACSAPNSRSRNSSGQLRPYRIFPPHPVSRKPNSNTTSQLHRHFAPRDPNFLL
jgi:hypothetical protein